MKIYNRQNIEIADVPITMKAEHEEEMMKSDFVKLSWESATGTPLPVDAYIIPFGNNIRYSLLEPYTPERKNEQQYAYEPRFHHPKMRLSTITLTKASTDTQGNSIILLDWSYTGFVNTLLQYICEQINAILGSSIGYTVTGDVENVISVSFSAQDILSALSNMANVMQCEWHIDWQRQMLYFGHISIEGLSVPQLSVGTNISVASMRDSREGYWNAYRSQGSRRNMPVRVASGENVESSVRLAVNKEKSYDGIVFDDGIIYTDGQNNIISRTAFEQSGMVPYIKPLVFEGVYPRINLYVYNVRCRERYIIDEKTGEKIIDHYEGNTPVYKRYSVWYIRLADKNGNDYVIHSPQEDILDGKSLVGAFQVNTSVDAMTSPLAGRGNGDGNGHYGFELIYHTSEETIPANQGEGDTGIHILQGDYEIVMQQTGNTILPTTTSQGLVPHGATAKTSADFLKGNIVCLYNVVMSDEDIERAQDELVEETGKYIREIAKDRNTYSFKSYPSAFKQSNPNLFIGQKISYIDGDRYTAQAPHVTRVMKLVTKLDYDFEQEITVGSEILKKDATKLKEQVDSYISVSNAQGTGNGSGGGTGGDSYWVEYIDDTGKKSVKLKSQYAGAWTEGFLSALGMSAGGGGGSVALNEPLESINNAGLSAPTVNEDGKTVVWDKTLNSGRGGWKYGTAGGGGISMADVWTALDTIDSSKQIDASHLSSALSGYATQSWADGRFLKLAGGTMTGQIYSQSGGGAWIAGRDNALIRKAIPNTSSWWPILSVKTADGSWEMGAISDNENYKNRLILSYATDENYDADPKVNNTTHVLFPNAGGTIALLTDTVAAAQVLKDGSGNARSASMFGNSYFSNGIPASVGVSGSNASLSYVNNISMYGAIKMHDYSGNEWGTIAIESSSEYDHFIVGQQIGWGSNQIDTYLRGYQVYIQVGGHTGSSSRKNAVSIDYNGLVEINQPTQGIKIGDAILSWDSTNNALKLKKIVNNQEVAVNFYATGGVSALGMSSTGGGGASIIMDDVWDALADDDGAANYKQIDITHLLCIPSWAKQSTKPSYTFSELTSHPTTLSGYGITNAMKIMSLATTDSIDTLYDAGSYSLGETAQGTWPTGVTANYGQMLVIRGGRDTIAQMYFPYGDTQAYLRVGNPMNANNGSWKGWKRLVTPDMNVASATKLETSRTLWGQSFNGTANVSGNMTSVGSITMSGSITMDNNTAIRMKDNSDNTVSLLHMDTGGNFVIGETADIYSHNTYLRGANFIFQQGTTSANRKELFRIDSAGNLYMKQYDTVLYMRSSANADYNVLTLNTNPNAAYSNWHLALGYGTAGVDYGTRIFGGATTGIKFLCGQNNEVASIYRAVDANQNVRQGIRIGDALLSWDSTNNALKVQRYDGAAANLYAMGGVSALGFTAPTSSIDAFTIDYLTSTKVTTGTLDVDTKINLGSSNCYIQAGSGGSLSINASAGLTLGNSSVYSDPMGGLHASKFYLDSTRYLYVSSGTLYYYNGTTSKQVMLS